MSNPLHLRQSLFALQARMKVIELHTWQNVQCKAGRLVWNYDRSSSPIVQPARSATKLWTTVRLGRTRMQRFTKLPLFVRTSPTFWVMLHGTLRHAPTPRRKVCAEWQHAACGLFPGHAGFGNHEGSKVYCWNRSWAEIKATAVRGTRQCRFACRWWASTERMGFRKLASKAWHIIVLVECFLEKAWTNYDRATEISHLSGVHPWEMRLLAKLRLPKPWPHLFLSISLPPHAPTPASNAKSFCGKNDVTVSLCGVGSWGSWSGSLKDDLALFHRDPWLTAAGLCRKRRRAPPDRSQCNNESCRIWNNVRWKWFIAQKI